MASIRALNDTLFLHVHRGVTAAQVRGRFGFIRISNRRRNSLAVVNPWVHANLWSLTTKQIIDNFLFVSLWTNKKLSLDRFCSKLFIFVVVNKWSPSVQIVLILFSLVLDNYQMYRFAWINNIFQWVNDNKKCEQPPYQTRQRRHTMTCCSIQFCAVRPIWYKKTKRRVTVVIIEQVFT